MFDESVPAADVLSQDFAANPAQYRAELKKHPDQKHAKILAEFLEEFAKSYSQTDAGFKTCEGEPCSTNRKSQQILEPAAKQSLDNLKPVLKNLSEKRN
jgi:hypothetical protein